MTLEHKIGQFFFPAVFINDTEENIQATERLIRDYNIGGLTFFHSRASAATQTGAARGNTWPYADRRSRSGAARAEFGGAARCAT